MNKTGIVIRKNSNKVLVRIDRTGECGDKCESCSASCHVPQIEVEVENTLDASIGDYVNIVTEHKTLISSSFILYTIPLLAFMVGIFMGIKISDYYSLLDSELLAIGTGFLSLIITYIMIAIATKNMEDVIRMESRFERFDL